MNHVTSTPHLTTFITKIVKSDGVRTHTARQRKRTISGLDINPARRFSPFILSASYPHRKRRAGSLVSPLNLTDTRSKRRLQYNNKRQRALDSLFIMLSSSASITGEATVEVQANNEQASGKSILGLMALGAGCGTRLTFTFVGEDAFEALGAVAEVFEAHFNQGGHN